MSIHALPFFTLLVLLSIIQASPLSPSGNSSEVVPKNDSAPAADEQMPDKSASQQDLVQQIRRSRLQDDRPQIFVPPFFSNSLLQGRPVQTTSPRRRTGSPYTAAQMDAFFRQMMHNSMLQAPSTVPEHLNYLQPSVPASSMLPNNFYPPAPSWHNPMGFMPVPQWPMQANQSASGGGQGRPVTDRPLAERVTTPSYGWMPNPYPARVVPAQPAVSRDPFEQWALQAGMPFHLPQYQTPINQANRMDMNHFPQQPTGKGNQRVVVAPTAQGLSSPPGGLFFEQPKSGTKPPKPQPPQYPTYAHVLPKPDTASGPPPPTFVLRTQLPPIAQEPYKPSIPSGQQQQQVFVGSLNGYSPPDAGDSMQNNMVGNGPGKVDPAMYYPQFRGNPSYEGFINPSTNHTSSNIQLIQSPINYCNQMEIDDHMLASMNLKRMDYFVVNMTCSNVFYQCALRSTFVRHCPGADQVFDETTLNCNYRYNVKSCMEYDHVMHCTIKNQCMADEYACCATPQQCLPYAKRCDGVLDCADGEDENNCPTCSINEFPCLIGGTCIPMERRCNGMPDDCFDGSNADEKSCDVCGPGKYFCYKALDGHYSINCIDSVQRCDGVKDCQGGEDELNCRRQGAQYLLCENQRQSVPRKQWCDGTEDCADGSDEAYCEY